MTADTAAAAELELRLRPAGGDEYAAEVRARQAGDAADTHRQGRVRLTPEVLPEPGLDPRAYGAALTAMVFADPLLREAVAAARGKAAAVGAPLRVRLRLDAEAEELHGLAWETLLDPAAPADPADPADEAGAAFWFASERVLVSRYLDSADPGGDDRRPRRDLRALVAVAAPVDLGPYGLDPVDAPAEVARAGAALDGIATEVLARGAGHQPASLAGLSAALRTEPDVLYLVCHGSSRQGRPVLWLEGADGAPERITGEELARTLAALPRRPPLVVLASCQSAGRTHDPQALAALGPRLAVAGVGAVVGLQGDATQATAGRFLAAFVGELQRDGLIDRAVAAARSALVRDRPDWWAPVLYLRLRDGCLWAAADEASGRAARAERQRREQELHLLAASPEDDAFLEARHASFVGRADELAEVRGRIDAQLATGGYVTITGQAGQGKSSLIAELVRARGAGDTAFHFIPLSPGPDRQTVLLKKLMARQILKHELSDLYVEASSRAELGTNLTKLLAEVAGKAAQEVIFVDGLDQLAQEPDGQRDLSFLPVEPPPGVVFALGTRPDDTLRQVQRRLHKFSPPYALPELSRADFDRLLARQGVSLSPERVEGVYRALQGNALYLDLAAGMLAGPEPIDPDELVLRVADDPQHLFSVAMEPLKRPYDRWERVIRPLLGLLLVAREPLAFHVLQDLLGVDATALRDGLLRLGGLVAPVADAAEGERRYDLFHLKFREYLREDEQRPDDDYVFDAHEERALHRRLAEWCAGGQGGLATIWQPASQDRVEQARRTYAAEHYVAHLFLAHAWDQLWRTLDDQAYAQGKLGHDPSTCGYAFDLDYGRQAAASPGWDVKEALALLPRLWHYSVVRCSLASRAEAYTDEIFRALVLLGRTPEALGLADLLDNSRQAGVLAMIGALLAERPGQARAAGDLLSRAQRVAGTIAGEHERALALAQVAEALATAGQVDETAAMLAEAQRLASAIADTYWRAQALAQIAEALVRAGQVDEAAMTLAEAQRLAGAIADEFARAEALAHVAGVLARAGQVDEAQRLAGTIADSGWRAEALVQVVGALARAGQVDEARRLAAAIPDEAVTLAHVAEALARANRPAEATATFAEAQRLAGTIADANWRAEALAKIASSLASVGRVHEAATTLDEARQLASATVTAYWRAQVLDHVAAALASAGQGAQAATTFAEARRLAGAIAHAYWRAEALAQVAEALARAGQVEEAAATLAEAQRAAATIADVHWRPQVPVQALVQVAEALARAGRVEEAAATLAEAQRAATTIADESARAPALVQVAGALARAGQLDAAQRVTSAIGDAHRRAEALVQVAEVLASSGQVDEAEATLAEAQRLAGTVADQSAQARALVQVARALARVGQADEAATTLAEAQRLAGTIPDAYRRAEALTRVAGALARAGRGDEGAATLAEAQRVAGTIPDQSAQARALRQVAEALSRLGRTEAVVRLIQRCWAQATNSEQLTAYLGLLTGLAGIAPGVVLECALYSGEADGASLQG